MMLLDNRLTRYAKDKVQPRLDAQTPEKQAEVDKAMAISFMEHYSYQNLQSQAFASGIIPADEAQYVYGALGEVWNVNNGGWREGVTTAEKVTITKYIGELMKKMGRGQ